MRRGLDSSASSSNLRQLPSEVPGRTQQSSACGIHTPGEHGASTPPQRSLRRRSQSHPLLPPELNEYKTPPPEPRSPAYLRGKNPYGRILDDIDHSYRSPTPAPTSLSTKLDSDIGCWPKASGYLNGSRVTSPTSNPKPKAPPNSPPTPPLQSARPASVEAIKTIFQSKALESARSSPFRPPKVVANTKGATSDSKLKDHRYLAVSGQGPEGLQALPTFASPLATQITIHSPEPSSDPTPEVTEPTVLAPPAEEGKYTQALSAPIPHLATQVTAHEPEPPSESTPDVTGTEQAVIVPSDTVSLTITVRAASNACPAGIDTSPDRSRSSIRSAEAVARPSRGLVPCLRPKEKSTSHEGSMNVFTEPRQVAQPLQGSQDTMIQLKRLDNLSDAAPATIQESQEVELVAASDRPKTPEINRLITMFEERSKADPAANPPLRHSLSRNGSSRRQHK
ncbi:hypothetical protein CC80DRAFT_546031 [Byssothecium circinans]|uniref:Uncharacterized protein n=1 Tax=Byssothecium circinans TaxID=147558 RepID=A0A6A5U310_9PLEO|nr:hypothetical protein CC80DRAFT_546031 [Byssothecium circinans]